MSTLVHHNGEPVGGAANFAARFTYRILERVTTPAEYEHV